MKKIIVFSIFTTSLLLMGNLALAQNCTTISVNAKADFKGTIDNNSNYFQNWTSEVKFGETTFFQYCPPYPAIQTFVTYNTVEGGSLKTCVYSFTYINKAVAITKDPSSTGDCATAFSSNNSTWSITLGK